MLRWNPRTVEALVLGDSAIAVVLDSGQVENLTDNRLDHIAAEQRRTLRKDLRAGHGFNLRHDETMRALVAEERRRRNTEHGYWIAEADPRAAWHAINRQWPTGFVRHVLIATDGITGAIGISPDLPNWLAVVDLAHRSGPAGVVSAARAAEEADPNGRHWPRSKPHDDKTLAVVTFR